MMSHLHKIQKRPSSFPRKMPFPSTLASTFKQLQSCAIAVAITASVAACSGPVQVANPPEHIETKLAVASSRFDFEADRGEKIFVDFKASPTLTAAIQRSIVADGFELAATRELATVTYEIDGAFQALRPATGRTAEVRAGDYAEQAKSIPTQNGRGPSILFSVNPIATVVGTVLSNAGNPTGARDAANIAAVGDPDGVCLAKCDGWIYQQRAVLRIVRTAGSATSQISVYSTVAAKDLQASTLFSRSFEALQTAVGFRNRIEFIDGTFPVN